MQPNSYPEDSNSDNSCAESAEQYEASANKPAKPEKRRTPKVSHGINVNFCKNPTCANFGIPLEEAANKGRGAENRYIVVGTGKNLPAARCNGCGEHFPIKSNDGVFEETWRIAGETFVEHSCQNQDCENHRIGISTPKAYYAFGLTKTGSQRYRCRRCNKIFSVKPAGLNPIARQQQSDKNLLIFDLLVGKMPLRRICDTAGIAPRVLYERIDFFYEQALAFLAERESKLPEMNIKRLYVGVDRQEYAINWARRKDKRNTILTAVASADNITGYVFGMHPNFDPSVDAQWAEQMAMAVSDTDTRAPFRKFARLWLQADFDAVTVASMKTKAARSLEKSIANTYKEAEARQDIESPETMLKEEKLPDTGMLVHSEYTLYGHFMRLQKLFKGAGKVRFFLDQDSGMRAACLGAFAQRIIDRTADAFYVSIVKDQTVDEKRRLICESKKKFSVIEKANPDLTGNQVKLLMLKTEIQRAKLIGKWNDKWVNHPLPSISEAEKASCFLTDRGDYDDDHLAWLHNKASLHAVDSWFNRVRRRSSMLERPITSAGNRGRTYYSYSPYKPEQVTKLLTILRVCHNYIWAVGEKKKGKTPVTPAMKLGLAKAPLGYRDIVYFKTRQLES